VKLFFVKVEVFQRSRALGVVPGIGEQHSSNIPEDGANGGQWKPPGAGSIFVFVFAILILSYLLYLLTVVPAKHHGIANLDRQEKERPRSERSGPRFRCVDLVSTFLRAKRQLCN
jgi:hypothetical protein